MFVLTFGPFASFRRLGSFLFAPALLLSLFVTGAQAQDVKIVKNDFTIDALDPGIKLFMREKMAEGNTRFSDDNIVLFLHGATSPSTCDFDLGYKDYSWADWLVKKGYVVYMGDYRNYGGSTREPAMNPSPAPSGSSRFAAESTPASAATATSPCRAWNCRITGRIVCFSALSPS